jgi:hypothetical protein
MDGARCNLTPTIPSPISRHRRTLKKFSERLLEEASFAGERLLRVIFQDEARLGRISDPRSCWAPLPIRPRVALGIVREYAYAYAAVSPMDGSLDEMIVEKMNTEMMNRFLDMIEARYPHEHIVMVLDGASSHRSKDLKIRDHVSLIHLPPYSPELNPAELIWDELREKNFANKVFDSMSVVVSQFEHGLNELEVDKSAIKSLSVRLWITGAITSS